LDSFPAYFPLAGRKVVIAGSGDAAEAKARLFEGSPATVVRLDGHEAYLPGSYTGATLAFIASSDEVFVQAAAGAARAARVLVNVVDRPDLCDFNTPAVIDRGEVVAAVGTGGSAPVLATMLRNDIEAQVPEGMGRVAALLARVQDEVRKALPVLHERRAFLRAAIQGEAAAAARAGDMARAEALLREALVQETTRLNEAAETAGRTARRLSEQLGRERDRAVDVLVADDAQGFAVVVLARRDVERLAPAEADADRLVRLTREGRQIARLITRPVDPDLVQALAEAGVAVEVLPVAQDG